MNDSEETEEIKTLPLPAVRIAGLVNLSRKHAYIVLTPPPPPLKPHFYIVKLGFTGVYIIFLITARKHRLWVLVRTASSSGSNEYPQSMS